ncbi:MAG: acyltransferase family protein [Ktedonobacteraceae bacterium]
MISRMQKNETQHSEIQTLSTEEPAKHERLFYLDWLRVIAVFGVILSHTGDIFDTLYWHTRQNNQGISWNGLATFGAEWGMSLVFLLAGASAWFALQSRSSRQFIDERFRRLLIPFIVAFIVLSPFQAYIMSYFIASGYSHYQGDLLQFFTYFFEHIRIGGDLKFLTIYGYHLWFLAFLYIISMMALPVLVYLKQARGSRIIVRLVALCKVPAGLFIFVPPIALVRILLWASYPGYQGWADFYTWFIIFVFGFILYADNTFQAIIRKQGMIFVAVSAVCIVSLIIANIFGGLSALENAANYSSGYMFYQLVISITIWSMTIAALYAAMILLNFSNKVLQYANQAILPFYILHEPVIIIIAFFVLAWDIPTGIKYVFVTATSLLVTLAIYELLIRRIKPIRWLFGMKNPQPQPPAPVQHP